MDKKRIIRILIIFILISVITTAAVFMGRRGKIVTRDGFYFDTYVQLTVYSAKDSKYLDECLKMCERYEGLFSRTLEGSDIYRINNAKGESVTVDPETYYLIERALDFCEESDGAVDITIAPLVDLWGFSHDKVQNTKPDENSIKETLSLVDYNKVILEGNNTVRLADENVKIDLGFIAKGYIADKLKEYLVSQNVKSAIISLGGNIVVIGTKPDGSDYNIGIKDPENTGDIIESLKVSDKSVVTSGTYERYVEYDGVRFHHILDTNTGYPAENNIKSVTILSESSLEGDALSTICLIKGKEGSAEILDKHCAQAIFY